MRNDLRRSFETTHELNAKRFLLRDPVGRAAHIAARRDDDPLRALQRTRLGGTAPAWNFARFFKDGGMVSRRQRGKNFAGFGFRTPYRQIFKTITGIEDDHLLGVQALFNFVFAFRSGAVHFGRKRTSWPKKNLRNTNTPQGADDTRLSTFA